MPNNRGISALGLCHPLFSVRDLISCFEKTDAIRGRHIDNLFNPKNSKNFLTILEQKKPVVWTIHIINGPGLNNNRVCSHEITKGYTHASLVKAVLANQRAFRSRYQARLRALKLVIEKAKAPTTIYICPWLEHTGVPQRAFEQLVTWTREIMPNVPVVNSQIKGTPIRGYINELHGNAKKSCDFADLDGHDFEGGPGNLPPMDLRNYSGRYDTNTGCFIWGLSCNGNHRKKEWANPLNRSDFPTKREFKIFKRWISDTAFTPTTPLHPKDTEGLDIQKFPDGEKKGLTWKLGEDKNFAVVVGPNDGKVFKRVRIKKNGEVIDTGRFYAFLHDTKRAIYWMTKHTADYPDNCVLECDGKGYILDLPWLRAD